MYQESIKKTIVEQRSYFIIQKTGFGRAAVQNTA